MTVNVKHSKPCKYFKSVSEDLQMLDANSGSSERPSERELGLSSLSKMTVCSLCESAEIVLCVSDTNFFVFPLELQALHKAKGNWTSCA